MSEEKAKKSSMGAWLLVVFCVIAVGGAWLLIDGLMNRQPRLKQSDFVPYYHLPLNQMVTLSDAIETYTKEKGKRPESLDELVAAKLIGREVLFDPARKPVPAAGPYDVIYNPAVRPEDSKDCVILYTIFVEREDEPFYAVHNDYTVSQFKPRELVKSLNDTYRIIGEAILEKQKAKVSAASTPSVE